MITDSLTNGKDYPLGEAWQKAIEFLKTLDASTPEGEYPLDGETMFARVMSYDTKTPDEANFEAHRKYADIQSVLVGAEGIAVADTANLVESKPYDPETDVIFFDAPETVPVLVDVYPGSFVFLLPQDCHMPQLQVEASQLIKKVVVKVDLSVLTLS